MLEESGVPGVVVRGGAIEQHCHDLLYWSATLLLRLHLHRKIAQEWLRYAVICLVVGCGCGVLSFLFRVGSLVFDCGCNVLGLLLGVSSTVRGGGIGFVRRGLASGHDVGIHVTKRIHFNGLSSRSQLIQKLVDVLGRLANAFRENF